MQIILVSTRFSTAKTIHIMPRHGVMALCGFFFLVFSTSALFSWLSVELRLPLVQDLVVSLYKRETQQSQDFMRNNLQLMATRLGELQAQVLQLDTLGERLSALAGIKDAGRTPPKPRPGQGGPLLAAPLSAEELQKEIDRLARLVESKTDELSLLENQLLEQRVTQRLLPTTLPVRSAEIGSSFGYRADPIAGVRALHEGIDFVAETGTPVLGAAAGVVLVSEYRPDYGNVIEVDHGGDLITRYAHLSKSLVKPGQYIKRGQQIGLIGNTGRSTGSHLHFEVRISGIAQNPARFLQQGEAVARSH